MYKALFIRPHFVSFICCKTD